MNKASISKFIKRTKRKAVKHSPEILTFIGITGMLTTTVLAVKATPKALELLEEKKVEEQKDELTLSETVKATWKCYIPAATSAIFSTACLIGANSVHAKRHAALATAYKLSETALIEYRDKVVETVGEKKEKTIRDKVNQEKVNKKPVSKNEVFVTGDGDTLCLEPTTERYFQSNIDKIKRAESEINKRLVLRDYVSLNELYGELGLKWTSLGDKLGWNITDGELEISTSATMADNGKPCIVLDYNIAPRYEFDSYS